MKPGQAAARVDLQARHALRSDALEPTPAAVVARTHGQEHQPVGRQDPGGPAEQVPAVRRPAAARSAPAASHGPDQQEPGEREEERDAEVEPGDGRPPCAVDAVAPVWKPTWVVSTISRAAIARSAVQQRQVVRRAAVRVHGRQACHDSCRTCGVADALP